MAVVDTPGRVPYQTDDTRTWVEQYRKDGRVKPWLILRIATDTNYVLNQRLFNWMSAYPDKGYQYTKAIMNLTAPGQRIHHVLNWQVNEGIEQPVSTASFEVINALTVSKTETKLMSLLPADYHSRDILNSYALNGAGVLKRVPGNVQVESVFDTKSNTYFREERVRYRLFHSQTFDVTSTDGFPNPAPPDDTDGNEQPLWYSPEADGVGSYYVKIDDEVIRVSQKIDNTFYIPPGGRAVNGILQSHVPNTTVTLLGYGSRAGETAAYGYLTPDDFKPYKNILRPGVCLVSYEGYGTPPSVLDHTPDPSKNYAFTGYWFVKGLETSLGDDMIPRIRVDLAGPGEVFNKQKITPDLIQRIVTQYGQWEIDDEDIFGAAGHVRNIPGDWVDYHHWDPTKKDSYPLKIKTSFAQHKEFYDHMTQMNLGKDCEVCMGERAAFIKQHGNPDDIRKQYDAAPDGPGKTTLGKQLEDLEFLEARSIGRHIYQQSIRVFEADPVAGPIHTYIKLMATLAAAAWEHPAYGFELSSRFTKIPNRLFDNMRDMYTGLIYTGQRDFRLASDNTSLDFDHPTYDDRGLVYQKSPLTCPFESTYDKAPFYQPMQDLADVNGNVFWVDREGRPCFMPRDFPMRPFGTACDKFSNEKYQWTLKHGASISAYSHSLNTDSVITQMWVTATTAFDSSFTIAAGGTGYTSTGKRMIYSPLGGNKDGLGLTSGVQQVDTISLDNQTIGLDWNTKVEGWGIKQVLSGQDGEEDRTMVLNAKPKMYDGNIEIGKGAKYHTWVERIQRTINFFLIRQYLPPIAYNSKFYFTIYEDGNFGTLTENALVALQTFVMDSANLPTALRPSPWANIDAERSRKNYGRDTFLYIDAYLNYAANYVKTDIWWYVQGGRTWQEYVGAITGIPVPVKANKAITRPRRTSRRSIEEPLYTIDDKGMQAAVDQWHKNYYKMVTNVGNRAVDNSINQATVRSITTNFADPRIQPGDIAWCEVPGHLTHENIFGNYKPPFSNGIYLTTVQRQMDLTSGSYNATYSGYRYRGDFGADEHYSVNPLGDFMNRIQSP